MLYRPLSFRKTALVFAAATAVALSAVPSFGQDIKPMPVASQPNEGVTTTTNCHDFKPGELMADTKCEILKGQALDAQGRVLDVALAKKQENMACMEKVRPLVGTGKVTREMLSKFGPNGMCELLGSLKPSG